MCFTCGFNLQQLPVTCDCYTIHQQFFAIKDHFRVALVSHGNVTWAIRHFLMQCTMHHSQITSWQSMNHTPR